MTYLFIGMMIGVIIGTTIGSLAVAFKLFRNRTKI